MIFTLNIIIDLLLIACIWYLSKKRQIVSVFHTKHRVDKGLRGKIDKMYISAKIAEKTADRAFNMASSANLGVIALQKSLATPRLLTKTQATRNGLAKKEVDELFSNNGPLDWLYPVASDEEREVLDKIREEKDKAALKEN